MDIQNKTKRHIVYKKKRTDRRGVRGTVNVVKRILQRSKKEKENVSKTS